MSTRRTMRRHAPVPEPLKYASAAQQAVAHVLHVLSGVESERSLAFLSAATAGWSMREIAEATGLSASTVCRIINKADASAAVVSVDQDTET